MTPVKPTPDWAALGAALKAHREGVLRMTRAQVKAAGGPSPATIQRIENGQIKTEIETATKRDLEQALQLKEGWIDDYIARRTDTVESAPEPVIIEGDGERLLVAITDGASRLTVAERRAVLALVRGLQKGPDV